MLQTELLAVVHVTWPVQFATAVQAPQVSAGPALTSSFVATYRRSMAKVTSQSPRAASHRCVVVSGRSQVAPSRSYVRPSATNGRPPEACG